MTAVESFGSRYEKSVACNFPTRKVSNMFKLISGRDFIYNITVLTTT